MIDLSASFLTGILALCVDLFDDTNSCEAFYEGPGSKEVINESLAYHGNFAMGSEIVLGVWVLFISVPIEDGLFYRQSKGWEKGLTVFLRGSRANWPMKNRTEATEVQKLSMQSWIK